MTAQSPESVRRYASASAHYLENALEVLSKQEAGKACELLWGSIAEALQAVAASRNIHLANHRSLRWFVSTLAKELADSSLSQGFWQAEALHSKFYEVDLTPEDVAAVVEPIRETVAKLLALIPQELLQQTPDVGSGRNQPADI